MLKHKNKVQVIFIIHMEMLHMMLKYLEFMTNLDFIKVSTFPLELWADIRVYYDTDTGGGAYVVDLFEVYWGVAWYRRI